MRIKDFDVITRVKQKLIAAFEIADIRLISFYSGLKVTQDWEEKILRLSQPTYIDKIFAKFHLDQTKTLNTIIKEIPVLPNKDKEATTAKRKHYLGMIDSIIFR